MHYMQDKFTIKFKHIKTNISEHFQTKNNPYVLHNVHVSTETFMDILKPKNDLKKPPNPKLKKYSKKVEGN